MKQGFGKSKTKLRDLILEKRSCDREMGEENIEEEL
jgi:hypothetical protein